MRSVTGRTRAIRQMRNGQGHHRQSFWHERITLRQLHVFLRNSLCPATQCPVNCGSGVGGALMEQKNIYIVLTRTTTVLSQLIAYITGDQYTHASISLDRNLTTMYSFGRKQRHNPLIGGFCRENMDKGIFADSKRLPYAIARIEVTPEQYEKVNSLIQSYVQNAAQYRYNYTGLLFAWMGKVHKSRQRFYCSEFVCDLLRQCKIVFEEPPTVIRPQDLLRHGQIIEQGDWRRRRRKLKATARLKPLYSNV